MGDVVVDVLNADGPSRKLGCSAFSNEALKSFMTARISVRWYVLKFISARAHHRKTQTGSQAIRTFVRFRIEYAPLGYSVPSEMQEIFENRSRRLYRLPVVLVEALE